DPNGFLVRRWLSRYSTNGVISLEYYLPRLVKAGDWNLRVLAGNQVFEQPFKVEEFFIPIYEYFVYAPAFLPEDEESFEVSMSMLFHTNWVQFGNISVTTLVQPADSTDYLEVFSENFNWEGAFNYEMKMERIRETLQGRMVGSTIRIEAILYDAFRGESRHAFSKTKIIAAAPRIEILGVGVVKPGLPLSGFVVISNSDSSKIDFDRLSSGSLSIKMKVGSSSQGSFVIEEFRVPKKSDHGFQTDNEEELFISELKSKEFWDTGVFRFTFFPPPGTFTAEIVASFVEEDDVRHFKNLALLVENNPEEIYVSVETSTVSAVVGSYAVFHFHSTVPVDRFTYLIMSKGLLLLSEQLSHGQTGVTTFAVPVGRHMAPSFQVIVDCKMKGKHYGDSITVPIEEFTTYKMNVTLNPIRDHSKKTVQVITRTEVGAFSAVAVLRQLQREEQGHFLFSKGKVTRALLDLEAVPGAIPEIFLEADRNGVYTPKLRLFPSKNADSDYSSFLDNSGISHVSADGISGFSGCPESTIDSCQKTLSRFRDFRILDEINDFRFARLNRHSDFYDPADGDWLWYDIPVSDDGIEFAVKGVAKADDTWFAEGFSVHPEHGLAFMDGLAE
ncbi:hypothetical protein QYM36_001471, partial [Artemia franciscana]